MKIRQMGAELFHAYRRTDGRADRETKINVTKLIVLYFCFANVP